MEVALQEGYRVYGFEMHGMARRGGAVATHIRFGKEVYSPLVPMGRGRLLVAFEPAEALRHIHFLSPDSAVIMNTAPVIPVSVSAGEGTYPNIEEIKATIGKQCENIITLDATALAEETGNSVTMNVVMLGAMCASGVLSFDQAMVQEVITKRTPERLLDINLKAFNKGYEEIKRKD